MSIRTDHIGLMLVDLINDHSAACEGDELPAFRHAQDDAHPVSEGSFGSCEADAPEGDYSNIRVTLDNGKTFRVQIFAR